MSGLTSAAGFIALLDDEPQLQIHALQNLNKLTELFWHEIADSLDKIEQLSENSTFPARKLAALVASKTFYHLGSFRDSMTFALGAEELFDLNEDSEYVVTLVAKCIDEYAHVRREHLEKIANDNARKGDVDSMEEDTLQEDEVEKVDVDPRLESIVERMFDKCFNDNEYKQALGMAVESLRLDIAKKAILKSSDPKSMLEYCYNVCMNLVTNREFRRKVLNMLVKLYEESEVSDHLNRCRCLVFLGKAKEIGNLFVNLLQKGGEDDTLLVFQVAFELVDNSTQQFLKQVQDCLPPAPEEPEQKEIKSEEDQFTKNLRILHKILEGSTTINFYLEFLYRNNRADLGILKKLKGLFEPRLSVLHTATIVANSIMHCGTTRDTFLRENLEWLSKAINWSKFITTAGLGVIHKGHLSEAFNVLDPYLPKQGVEASPFTEGGSLYAFGLIHANHGHGKVTDYLLQQLKNIELVAGAGNADNDSPGTLNANQKKEIVQHGAALGLGIAAMGSGNKEVCEELINLLYHHDSAIAGEAAGLACGLVMLGSANEHYSKQMITFAHNTQHEKIIRSLGLGLALIMYGLEEKADPMIETLNSDKDPILRYGGQFTIGLAYCGTANNKAIKQLLHIAVSDVSDDVRRAAVISLGFVLFRQPEQVPKLVSLLSESYNPHVRYGAAIALGIACAGTGMKEAINLLEPLTKDSVPFVRQGAYIALAMILIQISEKAEPKVKEIRQLFLDVVGDKHQSIVSKFGAIIGLGIIDGGGRNVTIALSSRAGHLNLSAVVGILVFIQYWYWYPFLLFISLAFTPTAIIGVNQNLAMPTYRIKSNARPSLFAYPPEIKEVKEKEVKAVPTAQLSITKKAQQRQEKKKAEKEKQDDKMQVDTEPSTEEQKEPKESEEKKEEEKKKDDKPEPEFELLSNPARVTRAQLKCITFDVDPRYRPITEGVHGIVLLKDTKPGEKEDIIEGGVPSLGVSTEEEVAEPEPPEPFEFRG